MHRKLIRKYFDYSETVVIGEEQFLLFFKQPKRQYKYKDHSEIMDALNSWMEKENLSYNDFVKFTDSCTLTCDEFGSFRLGGIDIYYQEPVPVPV